jgi:hypothetical protein
VTANSPTIPATRQAAAIPGRSARNKVTGKLKTALDLVVWSGERPEGRVLAELGHSQNQNRPLTKNPVRNGVPNGAKESHPHDAQEASMDDPSTGLARNNPKS